MFSLVSVYVVRNKKKFNLVFSVYKSLVLSSVLMSTHHPGGDRVGR